jgi:uncharacterized protein YukE
MEATHSLHGVFVERPVDFNPPEARRIAEQLGQSAQLIRELAGDLERVRLALDNAWQGNARNRFFQAFEATPRKVDGLAGDVQAHAAQVRGVTVTVYERVWMPGHVPE